MPIPEPQPGESQKEYLTRCINTEVKNGVEQKQAAAICYSKWNEKGKGVKDEEKNM